MSFVNGIINDILDTVFGKVYIATTSVDTNIFTFICDLIVLACYVFMFKHFCSFLTNLLTSVLKFDGAGFAGSTGGGSAFESNIVSQFAGAMGVNRDNWQKLTGAMSKTRGFRRFGAMAKRFNPFDQQGNLSFGAALQSIPNVKKEFDTLRKEGKFKGLKDKDEKREKFLKSRQDARQMKEDNKELNDLFKGSRDLLDEQNTLIEEEKKIKAAINEDKNNKELKKLKKHNKQSMEKNRKSIEYNKKQTTRNANKFTSINTSQNEKQQIKKQEMTRYKNSLARQIDELYISYHNSIENGADKKEIAELKHKLEEVTKMAVKVGLIKKEQREEILSSNKQKQLIDIKRITNTTGVDKIELSRFDKKHNANTIVNLSKLAQQGLVDASLFTDMSDDAISRWAEGNITKGEYEKVMKYIRSNNTIDEINKNIEYATRDDLDFDDLILYEEIYVNDEDYSEIEEGEGKYNANKLRADYIAERVKNRREAIYKKQEIEKLKQQIEQQQQELDAENEEMRKMKDEIEVGLSDENIELAPEEPQVSALVGNELEESLRYFDAEINMCAGVEGTSETKENELTKEEEDNLRHGESLLKVIDMKLKMEEFNKQKYQQELDVLQLELDLNTKLDIQKQQHMKSQIFDLNKQIAQSTNTIAELNKKRDSINNRISSLKDKQGK